MLTEFRRSVYDAIEKKLSVKSEDYGYDTKNDILSFLISGIGDYDGSIVVHFNFMPQYDEDDFEAIQIMLTLNMNVDEENYYDLYEKLHQLTLRMMYGNYGIEEVNGQIFYKYILPLKIDDVEYSLYLLMAVYKEMFAVASYYLPYIYLICDDPDSMTIEDFEKTFEEE